MDVGTRLASKGVVLAEARSLYETYFTTVYGMVYSVCSCGMLSDSAGTGLYLEPAGDGAYRYFFAAQILA